VKLEIEDKLAQAILDYLSNKPYVEVFQLIQGLQRMPEIKEDDNGQES
jgi:hypothetical protein